MSLGHTFKKASNPTHVDTIIAAVAISAIVIGSAYYLTRERKNE